MNIKRFVIWVLPAILLVLFGVLEVTGVFSSAEHAVYDAWLHLKPAVEEREELLFLDVDDLAISRVGVWPWSREIMARGLITLTEFSAGPVIFDIEYVDTAPLGVDGQVLRNQIPSTFDDEFDNLTENIEGLLQAIAAGQIPPEDAPDFFRDLEQLADQSEETLLRRVQDIVRDNDTVLGNAAAANGNAWFTVNLIPDAESDVPQERVEFAMEEASLDNVSGDNPFILDAEGLRPAIEPIMGGGQGAGFPNVIIDTDGVRRRIELLRRFEGEWFGQLVFAPLLHWVGSPEVEVTRDRVTLVEAQLPGEDEPRDVRIPLAPDGTLLLNWPKKSYLDSFRHLSYYELIYYQQLLEDLAFNLDVMEDSGYLQYHEGDRDVLRAWEYSRGLVEETLETGDGDPLAELPEIHEYYLSEVGAFLDGPAEEAILRDIRGALEDQQVTGETRELYQELEAEIPGVFESTRNVYNNLVDTREVLANAVEDSFIIIGYTGTGTTDIGVNPFENEYANTGTHGAVVNTILTRKFIDEIPLWISIAIGVILTVLYVLVSRNRSANVSLALGFAGAGVVIAGSALLMIVARLFLPILTPVLTILGAAIGQSVLKFIEVAREKSYIRNAFNHYLSTDVINEILDDPSRLRLGGEKRELTAMFTDVKGFSSISETLDPEELVKLLNRYLSDMSDIILQLRGTIDKYEGDAIISFFGAPIPYLDHASRACLSAVRMKKMEHYLNDHFLSEQLSPHPLATRIGINTGEMVVGNMGTANRMDYTIMGHSVNLAARLEGVNKQYGTWILVSELTYREVEEDFAARKLDRVRVVGVSEPVRLFEIIDESSQLPDEQRQLLDEFHEGLELFEEREFGEAGGRFSRLNREFPEDGPSKTYFDRCTKFQKEPPPVTWDGVFNLTSK
ncbi:MAG: adenylate/guanylate cyclase domain-containing protein [Alkalispirochaeta sp.]